MPDSNNNPIGCLYEGSQQLTNSRTCSEGVSRVGIARGTLSKGTLSFSRASLCCFRSFNRATYSFLKINQYLHI